MEEESKFLEGHSGDSGVASNPSILECETEFTLRIAYHSVSGKNILSCVFLSFFNDVDRRQSHSPFFVDVNGMETF